MRQYYWPIAICHSVYRGSPGLLPLRLPRLPWPIATPFAAAPLAYCHSVYCGHSHHLERGGGALAACSLDQRLLLEDPTVQCTLTTFPAKLTHYTPNKRTCFHHQVFLFKKVPLMTLQSTV